jgi:hypothetical protein|tara:strand:- start:1518 stop:1928 length:411 start_codon:yes stop_codon:yes gene_type:complete
MADRNTPTSFTLEEWRVEFNELAVDVGDIGSLPSTINGQSVTDVIESVVQLNSAITTAMFPNVLDFGDSTDASTARIKMGASDDLQMYHDGSNSIINHTGTGSLSLVSDSTTLTFPAVGGTISTEGFSIALAVALG